MGIMHNIIGLAYVKNPHANNWTEYSIQLMQRNKEIKNIFVEILQALGTGVKDIKVKLEKTRLTAKNLPQEMPEALKMLMISQEANMIEAKLVYNFKKWVEGKGGWKLIRNLPGGNRENNVRKILLDDFDKYLPSYNMDEVKKSIKPIESIIDFSYNNAIINLYMWTTCYGSYYSDKSCTPVYSFFSSGG